MCENRVREVYHDLSNPALLERCLRGENQNRNEGLHSKFWRHQSKAKFAGLRKFMTQLTIIEHNFGYEANQFLANLGFSFPFSSVVARKSMDRRKETPSKPKRKQNKKDLASPGPDYQPSNFRCH